MKIPVIFHPRQFVHQPIYEWAFGEKLVHPETSRRAENILTTLERNPEIFSIQIPNAIDVNNIHRVHSRKLTELYKAAELDLAEDKTFYPSVFPRRDVTAGNPRSINHAGYYSFDSGTPLTRTTKEVAEWSAACAYEAAMLVESRKVRMAYALCRPPGHHASKDLFGGYCYYNNAAIVANKFKTKSKVVIVDIDFHHGNGTQEIFYKDKQVLYISVHGDPREFYPYYTGHSNECGSGLGEGFNFNFPLPRGCDGQEYLRVIDCSVIPLIKKFSPDLLIISAGFDTYKEDPIGAFQLETHHYADLAKRFADLNLPSVIIQEGGYFVDKLGENVSTFLQSYKL